MLKLGDELMMDKRCNAVRGGYIASVGGSKAQSEMGLFPDQ
jgi:hypothetical protein